MSVSELAPVELDSESSMLQLDADWFSLFWRTLCPCSSWRQTCILLVYAATGKAHEKLIRHPGTDIIATLECDGSRMILKGIWMNWIVFHHSHHHHRCH